MPQIITGTDDFQSTIPAFPLDDNNEPLDAVDIRTALQRVMNSLVHLKNKADTIPLLLEFPSTTVGANSHLTSSGLPTVSFSNPLGREPYLFLRRYWIRFYAASVPGINDLGLRFVFTKNLVGGGTKVLYSNTLFPTAAYNKDDVIFHDYNVNLDWAWIISSPTLNPDTLNAASPATLAFDFVNVSGASITISSAKAYLEVQLR